MRLAWEARGFRKSPTQKQWAFLEGVNDHDPEALAGLIRDAPKGQSNEIVKYVLRHINADPRLRGFLATGPTAEGKAREHRCPTCDLHMVCWDGKYSCRWHGAPRPDSGSAEEARGDRSADAVSDAGTIAALGGSIPGAHDDEAPRCECGKAKVARPDGKGWVCTNPFGHPRPGGTNQTASPAGDGLPGLAVDIEAPA